MGAVFIFLFNCFHFSFCFRFFFFFFFFSCCFLFKQKKAVGPSRHCRLAAEPSLAQLLLHNWKQYQGKCKIIYKFGQNMTRKIIFQTLIKFTPNMYGLESFLNLYQPMIRKLNKCTCLNFTFFLSFGRLSFWMFNYKGCLDKPDRWWSDKEKWIGSNESFDKITWKMQMQVDWTKWIYGPLIGSDYLWPWFKAILLWLCFSGFG